MEIPDKKQGVHYQCKDHEAQKNKIDVLDKENEVQKNKIDVLEEKYSIVEENTRLVDRLSTKVTMLLSLITLFGMITLSGVVYTFSGISDFKDLYNTQRLNLYTEMEKNNKEEREYFMKELKEITSRLDDKIDLLDKKVTIIETKLSK